MRNLSYVVWIVFAMFVLGPTLGAADLYLDSKTVEKVQLALQREGFDPGPIDGIVGTLTRDALRRYQRKFELKESGTINEATMKMLGVKIPAQTGKKGMLGIAGSGAKAMGKGVAKGTKTAAKATAKATRATARKTKDLAVAGTDTTTRAAKSAGKAAAKGSKAGAKATATGVTTAAGATADAGRATGNATKKAGVATKEFMVGSSGNRELEKRVTTALEGDTRITASGIGVKADKGVVTLTLGSEDQSQRDLAAQLTERVAGVKQVFIRTPAS